MANIDFLIQNSTKKILNLVKGLPDREKIESAFHKTSQTSTSKTKRRFTKHPRHFKENDVLESTDEDNTATVIKDVNKEVVVIKNPKTYCSPRIHHNDSSDEYCDVTIRTEEIVDYSVSVSKHINQIDHECHHECEKDAKNVNKDKEKKGIRKENQKHEKIEKYEKLEKLEKADKCNKHDKCDEKYLDASKNKEAKGDGEHNDKPNEKEELQVFLEPKLKNLVEKTTNILKECRLLFDCGVDPPDGQEDCDRRKKRTFEFASRFARNYLYQLNRTILEIENIIHPPSNGRGNNKSANSCVLGHRFFNAFQTIYLALEAYYKHLPTGIVNGMPDKFRELLDVIVKLSNLYRAVSDPETDNKENAIDIFAVYCNAMLLDETLMPQSARESNSNMSLLYKRRLNKNNNNKQETRLSMYHVPVRKDIYWKKAVAALAKKKYQVPSKYKTATFKHRPPPPPLQQLQPPPLKLAVKKESKFSHNHQHHHHHHHDKDNSKRKCKSAKYGVVDMDTNVSTYVQDTDSRLKSVSVKDIASGDDNHPVSKNLRRHAQGFYHKVTKGEQEMTQGEYECILEHFLEIIGERNFSEGVSKEQETAALLERKFGKTVEDMDFQEFVDNLVEYANTKIKDETLPASVGSDVQVQDAKKDFKSKSTTISITGPTNAKLICMKDNSQSQSELSNELPSQMQQIDPEGHLRQRLSGLIISQPEDSNELIYKERTEEHVEEYVKPVKHERKKKFKHDEKTKPIPLRMLPKNVMLNIIEYKLQYHKEAKNNYMYKKSEDISPWLLVERVADSLLEETLLTITRDIQVEQILKKIYAQEFK